MTHVVAPLRRQSFIQSEHVTHTPAPPITDLNGAISITTTGNVAAANSVPSATAPDTGFTSR